MNRNNWEKLKGKRLLLTDSTRIARNEWTLLEISPNGKVAKFRNEIADCQFWTDLDELIVMDVLPHNDQAHRSAPGGEVERKGNDGNPK